MGSVVLPAFTPCSRWFPPEYRRVFDALLESAGCLQARPWGSCSASASGSREGLGLAPAACSSQQGKELCHCQCVGASCWVEEAACGAAPSSLALHLGRDGKRWPHPGRDVPKSKASQCSVASRWEVSVMWCSLPALLRSWSWGWCLERQLEHYMERTVCRGLSYSLSYDLSCWDHSGPCSQECSDPLVPVLVAGDRRVGTGTGEAH